MIPVTLDRERAIFYEALEHGAADRAAFIADACPNNPELAKRVHRLLAVHERGKAEDSVADLPRLAGLQDPTSVGEHRVLEHIGEDGMMIGRTLAHYEITARLGDGGMSEVYRATDQKLGREVALKILPADLADNPDRLARFEREARVVAQLNHPHIVTLFAVDEVEGLHFITMELVDGQPLNEVIPAGGLPVERLVAIAMAVADALETAHDQSIVHRDLKPANVMVAENGRIKVLDFGIARIVGDADDSTEDSSAARTASRTVAGQLIGTPAYMSPEQALGLTVDQRADIFALGILLYQMASGRHPFERPTSAAMMRAIESHEPPALSEVRAELPEALIALTASCLAKDPADRPTDREVRMQLAALESGTDTPTLDGKRHTGPIRARVGSLPESVDSFVARDEELASVGELLVDTRLVTLVGAGGSGKTRLALESARRLSPSFADGAWLVELAPLTRAEAVPHVVAQLLGVLQHPGKNIVQSLVDALRHRNMLLVLDNCEHLLDAAAALAEAITAQCAGVRILATSREGLAVRGEHVIRVPSLSHAHGAELFRNRALAAGALCRLDMETLTRLSQRLDGMPLAIELAAARSTSMSPEEIEQRLDDRFRLLRGPRHGRLERHQTLRNTVAWSYDLLHELERRVFDRLSVFAGGFSMEAARAVAGAGDLDPIDVEDTVSALVSRSMVQACDTEDGTRYRLLETLRQYAEEQLVESGNADAVKRGHVSYFADFMNRAWTGLWSANDPPWLRAVGREYENLRVAVFGAIDNGDSEALSALIRPHYWWAWQSLRYEVAYWAEAALAVSPEPKFARPTAVHLHLHGGRPEEALRLTEPLGDATKSDDPDLDCFLAWGRWNASLITGNPDMTAWMQRAVVAGGRGGNPARAAAIASIQVAFAVMAGEMNEARRIAVNAYDAALASGNKTSLSITCFFMGRAYSDTDPLRALQFFDRAATIAGRHHVPIIVGIADTEAAVIMAQREDPERARPRLVRALRAFVDSGDLLQLWTSTHHLTYFLARVGRTDEARSVWQELGHRQAYAARHHRDELTALLGDPGNGTLSDDDLTERIRRILTGLDEPA